MIFKSIRLKEGMFERTIEFSDTANLIHSVKNSRGKTTLLRFMLYGLGYNIPNTRKIKFNQCEVELDIECETSGKLKLIRNDSVSIQVVISQEVRTYVLPEQQNELQELIFGTSNADVLANILGAYYIDQEKGWTLLNRGTVIGSIHFNIEELIRGLSGIDCSDLISREAQLLRELGKYKQMFSVAQYREQIQNESGSVSSDSYEEIVDSALDQLLIEQRKIKAELNRIDNTLSDNKRFKRFVADMKLLVKAPDGKTFPVTENNIVGLNDAIELLIAKRKIVAAKYTTISSQIERMQKERDKEYEQLAFFRSASQIEVFDKNIARLPLNPIIIKREITRLENEIKSVRNEITRVTKSNNNIASDISMNIIKYATELGIGDKDTIPVTYLFTSNLKELSGAILHKTAFAFRLAYIIAIEKILKIKLPIILDSPSGKEVDQANIKLMMDILKRDFTDHQIIIASIFSYDFNNLKVTEIKNHLIEICEN